jgi:hypothetical protein
MASELFPNVSPGDKLRIPASTWNALMDIGRDLRSGEPGPQGGAAAGQLPFGVFWMRNDSGEDRTQFDVLGIDGILIDPANNLPEFLYTPGLVGVTPAIPDHVGRFAVLLEPIADGAIGRVRLIGVAPVMVRIGDEAHTAAEILDGEATILASTTNGSAQILWKESGTGDGRALIRFPSPANTKARKILVTADDAFLSSDERFGAHVVDWDDPDVDPDPADAGITVENPHQFHGAAGSLWEADLWPAHNHYSAIQGYCDSGEPVS